MWGWKRTVVSVLTQMFVHASKMSCFSDRAARAQKRFSVPGTGWGSPAVTHAQNCPRLPCGGIGLPWWRWIPDISLPRALWWGKETSQISQFFGEMWFCTGGATCTSTAKLVTFSSSWWLWWDAAALRNSCLGMRWAVSCKIPLISRAYGIRVRGLCWECQKVTKLRPTCSAGQKPAFTLSCWRCSCNFFSSFHAHVIFYFFFSNVGSGMEIPFSLEVLEYKDKQKHQSIFFLKCIYWNVLNPGTDTLA